MTDLQKIKEILIERDFEYDDWRLDNGNIILYLGPPYSYGNQSLIFNEKEELIII